MSQVVRYELDASIATITIDDGKVNCLSLPTLQALREALDRAEKDRAVVVLTGREGVFSAGFDLNVLTQRNADASRMFFAGLELGAHVLSFPTPVVIACSGHALAMAGFLLLAADLRIGADGPFRIGLNEVAIGMTMPHFGVEIARQRLTPSHFQRAVNTAEIFSPQGALEAGFLDHVVPPGELLKRAQEKAQAFSRLDLAAHAATKLRSRQPAIAAIRSAIEADRASMAALLERAPATTPTPR